MKIRLMSACCILVLARLAMPVDAWAGGIKGKVVADAKFQQYFTENESSGGAQKVDFYWEVENGVLPVTPPALVMSNRIGVALLRKDGATQPGFLPVHPEINGAMLVPGVVVAPPGATLKFHNADPFVHELYSDDLGKLFPPELQSSQQTRQVQFPNPGVYEVRCSMAPHLKGYIVILPGVVAFKNPADDGSFLFEGIAPGDYIVKIYFDGKEVGSQAVTVVDSDKEKDFAVVEVKIAPPATRRSEEPQDASEGEKPEDGSSGKADDKSEGSGK